MRDLTRYFLLPPSEIAHVGFTVHAYEGIAVVRTLNGRLGLIEMLVAPDFQEELEDLLKDLSREIRIRELSKADAQALGAEEEGSEISVSDPSES